VNGARMWRAADVLDFGRRLLPVKAKVPPGKVHKWLTEQFGEQAETARKCIQAAAVLDDRLPSDRSLPIDASAIYVLSKARVPDEIRVKAIESAKAGERITHRAVVALVREATSGVQRG
jgi:hypothetical protein